MSSPSDDTKVCESLAETSVGYIGWVYAHLLMAGLPSTICVIKSRTSYCLTVGCQTSPFLVLQPYKPTTLQMTLRIGEMSQKRIKIASAFHLLCPCQWCTQAFTSSPRVSLCGVWVPYILLPLDVWHTPEMPEKEHVESHHLHVSPPKPILPLVFRISGYTRGMTHYPFIVFSL